MFERLIAIDCLLERLVVSFGLFKVEAWRNKARTEAEMTAMAAATLLL